MKATIIISIICLLLSSAGLQAQEKGKIWSLQECIEQALHQNIQVKKANLSTQEKKINAEQSAANKFPSVSASAGQNFSLSSQPDANNQAQVKGNNSTNLSINSSVVLYNGNKIKNGTIQSKLSYDASQYDAETTKESISLNVLSAYLQVLYAEEQVKNTQKQLESTNNQLKLAEEKKKIGTLSQADYLQVKSQLFSEKHTLANAESLLSTNKVALMQLMELTVTDSFTIAHPKFDELMVHNRDISAETVYKRALIMKPQIKSAELSQQSAILSEKITEAGVKPSLSLSTGINANYAESGEISNLNSSFLNKVTPTVGLTLSIPIYQNKELKSKIATAKIDIQIAELNTRDIKNQLRKSIEQASVDINSAEKEYEAGQEQYNATNESYLVAEEKYNQGIINSVDFLIQKTNLTQAENTLLQAKYNLIFSYKTLDFYLGIPLTLQ